MVRGLFGRGGPVIRATSVVGLTGPGRTRAEQYSESGIKEDILIALMHGEMTVSDLAKEINESVDDTKRWLLRLGGYVRFSDVG